MPQGVGYGAILRGPDGGPAIDHVTGQPLTMEELLRRQGIIPWYERATPTVQGVGNSVSGVPQPVAGVPGVTFPPSGVDGPTGGAPVEPLAPGAPSSLSEGGFTDLTALADDPEVQAAVATLDPPEQSMFWKLLVAGTAATAVAAWLANRLMRKGTPVPPKVAQVASAPISVPIPGAGGPALGSPETMTAKPVLNTNIPSGPVPPDIAAPQMPARLLSVKPVPSNAAGFYTPPIVSGPPQGMRLDNLPTRPANPITPRPMAPPKANDMAGPPLDDGVKRTVGRQVSPRSRAAKALARARK